KVRHAYDPFAPPQVSGLPGVRGKAQPGREVKSPEIKWAEATTVPLRTHGSGAAGAAGPVQAKQGRSIAPAGVAGAPRVLRAGDHGEFVAGELIVKLKDVVKVNGAVITRGASTATPALERVLQRAGAQGKLVPVFKNAKQPAK